MAQNSHIFLVKASHMTKPDRNGAWKTSTFHREMEQVIKNNDIVSLVPYIWNATICPSFSPFFKLFEAILSPPLWSSFVATGQLAHFSAFSQDSGPTSNKVLVALC